MVKIKWKDRVRAYEGMIEETGSRKTNHWGTELHGFRCPDLYASRHIWYLQPNALQWIVDAQTWLIAEGKSIVIVDAWRTYERQQQAYEQKPGLAVPPDVSKHPRGIALDLRMFDSDKTVFHAQDKRTWGNQQYLISFLKEFGWENTVPSEEWHFDFIG